MYKEAVPAKTLQDSPHQSQSVNVLKSVFSGGSNDDHARSIYKEAIPAKTLQHPLYISPKVYII
jgi:hypothetical protein